MNKHSIIVTILIAIGALIRLLWLGDIPRGFFKDESAFVYNAYSIWLTGKDEFGISFPLIFRSFEVFLLPLYIYISAPIVGIFGLNEFTARLLSAIAGVAALIISYLIAKELWNKKVGVFSLVLMVFAPWHLLYSRGVFEGNLALTLFSAGFLLLIRFFKAKKQSYMIYSALFFTLSMYSYQAERVVVPAFALGILIVANKKLWKLRGKIILPAVISLIILFPILSFSFKAAGVHRAFGVSVFNKPPHALLTQTPQDFWTNNEFFLRSKQVLSLYLSYFSPRNLYIEGDSERQRSVDGQSVFYTWTFPFLAIGSYFILRKRTFYTQLLIAWIFAAPIPAALTGDPFHTYRSLLLYLPLTLVTGFGMSEVYRSFRFKRLFLTAVASTTFVSFFCFVFNYAIITQATHARSWDYGYKEIFTILEKYEGNKIVFHDRWTEAYIHMLFFNKFDPNIYHSEVLKLKDPKDFYYNDPTEIRPQKVQNYEFRLVDWPSERGDKGTIFVFDVGDLPESEFRGDPNIELIKEVFYPDGKVAYRIVRVKD